MKRTLTRQRAIRLRGFRNVFNTLVNSSSVGGILLMIVTAFTLIAANTPALYPIVEFWDKEFAIAIGSFEINMTFLNWVNDGLMAIFFFVVGMEIKREMIVGELASLKQAALPITAAIGGMVFPALIFFVINKGTPTQHGWGIPMATDIAFSLGVVALLGSRVPVSLKVFLTALAIVDDLGAILVLAIFYPTHAIDIDSLLVAAAIVGFLITLTRLNVHAAFAYIIPGLFLWYFMLQSGIHATIAGVTLAMIIPSKAPINEVRFFVRSNHYLKEFKAAGRGEVNILANNKQLNLIHKLHNQVRQANPLINRLEYMINRYVTFAIMPIFALANAGVQFDQISLDTIVSPLSMGIFCGLLLGKPIGIFISTFISCKLGLAEKPDDVKWKQIFSVGILAGIGFTMSIFIDSLAFSDPLHINEGKAAIVFTSMVAAVLGLFALRLSLGKGSKKVKYKKIKDLPTHLKVENK